MTEERGFGKKIEYDSLWQGPLQKERSLTDFYCSILLIIFAVIWVIVAVIAFKTGNIQNLLPAIDSEGRRCGIDIEVQKQPYLLFFNIAKCNNGTCLTTQSCLSECPKSNFLYDKNEDIDRVKSKLICKLGVNVEMIKSHEQIDNYIKKDKCAGLYLESKSIFKRCIPKRIPDDFKNKSISNETIAEIEKFVELQIEKENVLAGILRGFSNMKYKIAGFIILAGVLSIIYLFAMRWLTKFFVYFTIFLVCALVFYFICQIAMVYSSDKNRTDALIGLILSVIVIVTIISFTIFFWRKINIACQIIKESSKAALCLPSTLAFPILPFLLYVVIAAFAAMVLLYLLTIKDSLFIVKILNDGCQCPENLNYKEGAICDPKVFLDKCRTQENVSCYESGCRFFNSTTPSNVIFMQGINGFGFYWIISFISAFGHIVLAGTFATWYWTSNKTSVPKFALFNVLGITIRYHLGSIALGSLILTIARTISQIVESLKNNSSNRNFGLEILRCIVDAIESALKFLTRYTYIMIAIHGQNFFKSAKEAFNLLMRNILNVIIVNKISDWILTFGILLITGLTMTFTWLSHSSDLDGDSQKSTELWILFISSGIGSCFISWIIVEVLKTAIDTIFICFLEDSERNDGTAEKPYFMNFKLRQMLQK